MKIELGFGDGVQALEVPDKNLLGVLLPARAEPGPTGEEAVALALDHPIDAPRLEEAFGPGQKIAIITSDITRPLPSYKVLPQVLDRLMAAGVQADDITVVFALGSHRPHTAQEMEKLVGPRVWGRVKCIDSDPDDYIHMGRTAMGTPVDITRVVAQADRRIALGNVEYHYFAGYSGGAKALMPGVSTRQAIQHNHSRMVLPQAAAGRLEGNPVREDIEEAAGLCRIDYIVNAVLDEHKEIIYAAAGHHVAAHRRCCDFLDRLFMRRLDAPADIVVASQGGAPKDLNLYQTQKALDNAARAVGDGGIVILAGSCREGLGERVFEQWMLEADSPDSLVERIQQDFRLGGHKAAAIAMVAQRADIFLVSQLEPQLVERMFMRPFDHVQQALDAALAQLGGDARVLVMPYGGSTLPVLE